MCHHLCMTKNFLPKEGNAFFPPLLRSLRAQVSVKLFSLLDLIYLIIPHGNKCDRNIWTEYFKTWLFAYSWLKPNITQLLLNGNTLKWWIHKVFLQAVHPTWKKMPNAPADRAESDSGALDGCQQVSLKVFYICKFLDYWLKRSVTSPCKGVCSAYVVQVCL